MEKAFFTMFAARKLANNVWLRKDQLASAATSMTKITRSLPFGLQAFQDAVKREVCEELAIQGAFDARPVGLINDDSTEVGRVHFGIVHVLFRTPEQVKKNEQVITQVGFIPIEQLKTKREQMESWSQLCLDNLDALLK